MRRPFALLTSVSYRHMKRELSLFFLFFLFVRAKFFATSKRKITVILSVGKTTGVGLIVVIFYVWEGCWCMRLVQWKHLACRVRYGDTDIADQARILLPDRKLNFCCSKKSCAYASHLPQLGRFSVTRQKLSFFLQFCRLGPVPGIKQRA